VEFSRDASRSKEAPAANLGIGGQLFLQVELTFYIFEAAERLAAHDALPSALESFFSFLSKLPLLLLLNGEAFKLKELVLV